MAKPTLPHNMLQRARWRQAVELRLLPQLLQTIKLTGMHVEDKHTGSA